MGLCHAQDSDDKGCGDANDIRALPSHVDGTKLNGPTACIQLRYQLNFLLDRRSTTKTIIDMLTHDLQTQIIRPPANIQTRYQFHSNESQTK
jgi:hypothetical protein